ncbi:MAG: deoxynucleoside kinase [Candidatus Aminicenantes bacterium]|nr:deoxynucleoside kinase [Candidatus Aminicenantes bacterium]MCK5003826.1 deoxynucleoside kinase [Candidatus Aminicenantes bacterium]
MEKLNYIVIDGLVRTGKTDLAHVIAEEFNSKIILDDKNNPFADEFYMSLAEGENSFGLKNQLIYLLNRYSQQMSMKQKGLFYKSSVSNYLFSREAIYSHVVLNDEDIEIYKRIYGILSEKITVPDLVVYLQISFSEMIRRIKASPNKFERNVPQEYWRELFEAYNYYFFNYRTSPLLVVNVEKIDLGNKKDVSNLINEIKNHEKGIKYYAPL